MEILPSLWWNESLDTCSPSTDCRDTGFLPDKVNNITKYKKSNTPIDLICYTRNYDKTSKAIMG